MIPVDETKDTGLITCLLEYKNPLVIFCAGILIGATFYFRNLQHLYGLIFCLCICVLFLCFRNTKILILLFSILFGYFYTFAYLKYFVVNLDFLLNKRNIYIGEIVSATDKGNFYNKTYTLSLHEVPHVIALKHKLLLPTCSIKVISSRYEEYLRGDIVQLTGVLKAPKGALLPGLFNEKYYLLTKNIHYILRADPGSLVFLDKANDAAFFKNLSLVREILNKKFAEYLPYNSLSLINGIVFGSKAVPMLKNLQKKMQDLGLSHITSASGFNVAVLSAGIFYVFKIFSKRIFLPTIFSLVAVIFYCFLADCSSSVVRASVFIVLFLIGNLFSKKLKILPAVCLILLLFFVCSPLSVLDIGLQLSIFAFFGIAFFVSEVLKGKTNLLFSVLVQSFFAQLMVMPVLVFYFHNVQVLGLLANIVAVPLASIILVISLISLLFAFVPHCSFVISCLCYLLKLFSNLFLSWTDYLYRFPVKQIFLPNLNFYLVILIYIFILTSLCMCFIPAIRRWSVVLLASLIIAFVLIYCITDTSKYLKIFNIQKYNKDCLLIMAPRERPVFITSKYSKKKDEIFLRDFLRLNNFHYDYIFYDLSKENPNSYLNPYIHTAKNKIEVQYENFSFDFIKNYNYKITSKASCIRLPILKKSDPVLAKVFFSYPTHLIINDYKRLAKKSSKDIVWLKSLPTQTYFLSETGTITLVTDGVKLNIITSN